jgi:hypothetical protein
MDYGEKRSAKVCAQITLVMCQSRVTYERMGYWDDISLYQGEETLYKLERLKQDMSPENYERLKKLLEEDSQ